MTFHFHPEARDEYLHAALYYSDISTNLGNSFISHIENAIQQILNHTLTWPVVEEDIRRYFVKRFPYAIYYTIESDQSIMIQAVMHLNRKPGYWKNRIK